MKFLNFLVILCLTFSPILTRECITPNGFSSQCKLLNDCAPLLNYLQVEPIHKMTQAKKQYLNMLLCDENDNREQYVCCATNDPFFNINTQPPTTTTTQPPTTTTTQPPTTTTTQPPTTTKIVPTTLIFTNRYSDNDDDILPNPNNSDCGVDLLKFRIVGGGETELGEYPWMALLAYEDKVSLERSFSCGGSLIHHSYVLTAAHCLIGNIIKRIGRLVSVRLGEHNLITEPDCITNATSSHCADPVVDVGIKYVFVHSFYNVTRYGMDNDIGLIQLAQTIIMTPYIQPICFITNDLKSPDGKQMIIAGWGRTRTELASHVKKHVSVPIVNYEECRKALGSLSIEDDVQICAGGKFGEDTCNGDSGGPLMVNYLGKWYIEGVTSLGASRFCGEEGKPTVYTRVSAYHDWVINTIENEYS